MKKLSNFTVMAISIALIVFGILFCLNSVLGATLDIIFGICFILLGVGLAVVSFYNKRSIMSVQGIAGGVILAFGITMIDTGLIAWFIYYLVPFVFIVIGAFLVAEAFLLHFLRGEKKTALFVVELVAGGILLTLGILAIAIPDVQFKVFNIIEGAILIFIGVYLLVAKLVAKKDEE